MKKIFLASIIITIISCATKKVVPTNALFEILTEQNDGGAGIQFYEILTESKEIKMLLSDKNLKNKIQEKDIETSNFIILNAGSKNDDNYKTEIESVVETADKIIIKVKTNKNPKILNLDAETVNPYLILKINSKKDIVFE